MTKYSHSKISCFEKCSYQYKLQYVDKIELEVEDTIESFMGRKVHEALEKLYKEKKFGKEISIEELLEFYKESWEKEIPKDILVVKFGMKKEDYKRMGARFILDYFNRHKSFSHLEVLDLETQDFLDLSDGNQWHVRIDKLCKDGEGNYFVCDYKTSSRMKNQEDADSDSQLAMYSLWVKNKFPDAKSVKLVWHMLAFDEDIVSERNEFQLRKLEKEIVEKIKKIERAEKEKDFFPNVTKLCDYCLYKKFCPAFGK